MPDAFRSLCMMINTEKGKQIRKYYITLEKLIKSYNLYQSIFRCHEAERAMTCKGDKIDEIKAILLESEQKRAQSEQKRAEERTQSEQKRSEERTQSEQKRSEERTQSEQKRSEEEKRQDERYNKLIGVAEEN